MNTNVIVTAVVALVIVVFIFTRQISPAARHAAESADAAGTFRGSWWRVPSGPSGAREDRCRVHRRGARSWHGPGERAGDTRLAR